MGDCFSTPQSEIGYGAYSGDLDVVTKNVKILLDNPPSQKEIESPSFRESFYSGNTYTNGRSSDKSPIGWACRRRNLQMLKEVLKLPYFAKTAVADFDRDAGSSSVDDLISFTQYGGLVNRKAFIENNMPGHDVRSSAVDCIKLLLAQNPALNEEAVNRVNPRTNLPPLLEIASVTPMDETSKKDAHELCIELLANGADPFFFSSELKTTALHIACKEGNHLILAELLSNHDLNSDEFVNRKDGNGATPLSVAAADKWGRSVECFTLLLGARDVDVDAVDDKGFSVLDYCVLTYRVTEGRKTDMKPKLHALLFSSKRLPKIDDDQVTQRLQELSKTIDDTSESIKISIGVRKMIEDARAKREKESDGGDNNGRVSLKGAQAVI